MNPYEYSDDQIRSPLRTIVVCVIVLILGSLLCCVGSARGETPKSLDAGFGPTKFTDTVPGVRGAP